jgi:RNA-binding protein
MKRLAKNDPTYAHLMKLAHALHPIVTISNNGLQEAHDQEIATQFLAHELLKIKLLTADKALKEQYLHHISTTHDATLVNTIGHVSIWFKKHKKPSTKK